PFSTINVTLGKVRFSAFPRMPGDPLTFPDARRPKGRDHILTNALRMPPRPARIKRHRHFDRIPKRASTRFCHLRNLYKDELPPPPLPEMQSLNLNASLTTVEGTRPITTAPGCELRLDADSEAANDPREPPKQPRPLRTKGPIS
ncbi:LOW QUALITY PROTEIN: hypothetical protein HID58_019745, partial [Brassica napus]